MSLFNLNVFSFSAWASLALATCALACASSATVLALVDAEGLLKDPADDLPVSLCEVFEYFKESAESNLVPSLC